MGLEKEAKLLAEASPTLLGRGTDSIVVRAGFSAFGYQHSNLCPFQSVFFNVNFRNRIRVGLMLKVGPGLELI